jgi:hypothetical protein
VRLCKDCRNRRGWWRSLFGGSECASPKNLAKPDLVTGKRGPIWLTCHYARRTEYKDSCGPQAQWFEPRSSDIGER